MDSCAFMFCSSMFIKSTTRQNNGLGTHIVGKGTSHFIK